MKKTDHSFRNEMLAARGDMMKRYFLERYRAINQKRTARLRKIRTRKEAEIYRDEVRAKIRKAFGPMPDVKPENLRITGQAETEKLLIDKVLFESRPGFVVPALFYRRKECKGRIPGALFFCGHDELGKAYPDTYQAQCQRLALLGFGVLAPETYGQGERREFGGGPAAEHNRFGLRLGLLGEYFGAWRVHDALTAVACLKSRPEIDGSHIGITGSSGGGTLTSFVNAFSDDVTMAAPVVSMTTLISNLQNEVCGDCEQNTPDFLALGLDAGDLLLAQMPRPVMLGVQKDDFFDPEGTRIMYEEVRRIYALFGAEKEIVYNLGEGIHCYSLFQQEKIGAFFAGHAGLHRLSVKEEEIQRLPEKALLCTPENSVWKLPGAKTTPEILEELLARTKKNRKKHSAGDLKKIWKRLLQLKTPTVPEWHKQLQQYIDTQELHASRFSLHPEPGIMIGLKKIGPGVDHQLQCTEEIDLVVPEHDGIREIFEYKLDCRNPQRDVFTIEIRDTGESLPAKPESDLMPALKYHHSMHALMLGQSLLGGQVQDILSALALLKTRGAARVNIYSRGDGCIPAAVAVLFSPLPVNLNLTDMPQSCESYLPDMKQVRSDFLLTELRGILKETDLPELFESVLTRRK